MHSSNLQAATTDDSGLLLVSPVLGVKFPQSIVDEMDVPNRNQFVTNTASALESSVKGTTGQETFARNSIVWTPHLF
jgi:hypothetical protein